MVPRMRRIARKMTRRMVRRAAVGPIARGIMRRHRRRVRRRAFRIRRGPWFLLALAGTAAAYKLAEDDYDRIKSSYDKSPEDLSEEDLKNAMNSLGITKIELTPEEQDEINTKEEDNVPALEVKFCSQCGHKLEKTAKFCEECGFQLKQ
jgi:hypothetical protein